MVSPVNNRFRVAKDKERPDVKSESTMEDPPKFNKLGSSIRSQATLPIKPIKEIRADMNGHSTSIGVKRGFTIEKSYMIRGLEVSRRGSMRVHGGQENQNFRVI